MSDSRPQSSPASSTPSASSGARPLRIGLVGAGFLARTRARCWSRVFGRPVELAGVVASALPKAESFAREWGVSRAFRDLDELLGEGELDLVDLCVPNHLHRPMTERAAAAGLDVLCTKPLAAYVGQDLEPGSSSEAVAQRDRHSMLRVALADAEAMVAAADEHGVRLHYGENWIYAPSLRRAAALAADAKGPLLEMRGWESHSGSHSPFSKDWRHTGGGALLRLGAHPIGAMLWLKRREGLRLTGRPIGVASVTAEVADPTAHAALDGSNTRIATGWKGVESWGCAVLAFEDGTRGVASGSDLMLGGMQSRLQLFASDHHLECNLSPNDLLKAYATEEGAFGSSYLMEKLHGQAGWSTPIPDEDWSSGQQGLCQAVAEAVADGRRSEADGSLGADVTRVIYAAYVSAAEGRRVVLADL